VTYNSSEEAPSSLSHRLDRWLRRNEPYKNYNFNQAQIEKLLRQKKILVNGKKATSNTRITDQDQVTLAKGVVLDKIAFDQPPALPILPLYEDKDMDFLKSLIIWEDEEICVINKPAGLAVQGGTKTAYHLDGLLQAYGQGKPFRLVHRLDKETSGVLVVAKTLEKAINLAEAFQKHRVKKIYWALVEGVPNPAHGSIKVPILKNMNGNFEKVTIDPKNGKPALTDYRLIKALGQKAAWVELCPHTGRMHQLRVHCSYIGHPILGDGKYGSTTKDPLCLHARKLTIPDSEGGYPMTFTAPPPASMEAVLKKHKVDWEKYC
jgi:23S rRNA pseudouridine955/2504/2580 synthase